MAKLSPPLRFPQEPGLGTTRRGPKARGREAGGPRWGEGGKSGTSVSLCRDPKRLQGEPTGRTRGQKLQIQLNTLTFPSTVSPNKKQGPPEVASTPSYVHKELLGNPSLPWRMLDKMTPEISCLLESLRILPQDRREDRDWEGVEPSRERTSWVSRAGISSREALGGHCRDLLTQVTDLPPADCCCVLALHTYRLARVLLGTQEDEGPENRMWSGQS